MLPGQRETAPPLPPLQLPPLRLPPLPSPMDAAPVDRLKLVTPYPHGLATNTELSIKEISSGRPCVLHLFTG